MNETSKPTRPSLGNDKMTLVIRADAGPNIGTGHVMRTLAR